MDYTPKQSTPDTYTDLDSCLMRIDDLGTDMVAFDKIMRSRMKRESLVETLASKGFRKFSPFSHGTSAIVLDTTENQVIRIHFDDSLDRPRAKVHEEIQPIVSEKTGSLIFEVLPKLKSSNLYADYHNFKLHLREKSYYDEDLNVYNKDAGYLPDGTFMGIDKNAIEIPENSKEHFSSELDAQWVVASDKQSIFPYLQGTGFISKQEHFFPALMDGRVRGVLSDADKTTLEQGGLETLRAEKPECFTGIEAANLAPFMALVFDEGWYPAQAHEIMHEQGLLRATPASQIGSVVAGSDKAVGWRIG